MRKTMPAETRRQITNEWLENLAGALERATGSKVLARRVGTADARPSGSGMIWWQSGGEIWVGVERAAWSTLAAQVRAGIQPPAGQDAEDVYAALLNQTWNRSGSVTAVAPQAPMESIGIATAAGELFELLLAFGGPSGIDTAGLPEESALGVLLDIALPVTLRFGRTRMMLDEVLALNTGSVVEFDGALSDPIEVLVNGHVVARGEAVTVEGNYAVRISEIVGRGAHEELR